MAKKRAAELPVWEPPPPRKLVELGLDRDRYKMVIYRDGHVYWLRAGREEVVIASPGLLREPDQIYYVDHDGDLAVRSQGTPWSPPLVIDRKLAAAPLPVFAQDPTLAGIRFHKLPLPGPPMFESELIEPARALEAWQAANRRQPTSGFAPLVRTHRFSAIEAYVRDDAHLASTRKNLARASRMSVPKLLEARRRELAKTYKDLDAQVAELARTRVRGSARPEAFYFESDDQYVVLVLVGCPPAELLGWLGFGGWNECPDASELMALLATWQQRFGTELVAAGGDRLELRLEFPLEARLRKELAWEQYLIASDVVYQGTSSLTALADELAGGRVFMWWD